MSRGWLVVLVGCADEPESPPPPTTSTCGAPTLEVGTGEAQYEPLIDGGTLELFVGPSSPVDRRFHANVAGRVRGLGREVAVHVRIICPGGEITDADDLPWGAPAYLGLAAYDLASDAGELWGVRVYPPLSLEEGCALNGTNCATEVRVESLSRDCEVTSTVDAVLDMDPSGYFCP